MSVLSGVTDRSRRRKGKMEKKREAREAGKSMILGFLRGLSRLRRSVFAGLGACPIGHRRRGRFGREKSNGRLKAKEKGNLEQLLTHWEP